MVQPISNVPAVVHNPVRPSGSTEQPRVKEDSNRPQQEQEISHEVIQAAAEAANQLAKAYGTDITFELDEKTHIEVMRVVDSDSGKIIKEMPPQAVIEMIGRLWETIGVFIDAKA